jgi:purine-nucleoside phosphorylase
MRAVAVSCITNKAAGLSVEKLNHQEVMDAGKAVAGRFEALIIEFVRRL